jgi:GMP reductase
VGVPQLTAVMDCAEVADDLNLLTIADGGINDLCDFAKAFGAGADFVMAGSFFGGHSECAGYIEAHNNVPSMKMYGMSSEEAQKKHYSGMPSYRASEGRVSMIPFKGKVEKTVQDILGSIRSTMTYTDTQKIENLSDNVTFIKVNQTINNKYAKLTVGT